MRTTHLSILSGVLACVMLAGCGSGDAAKPSSAQDVTEFKGNPTSPAVQQSIRAHFGGSPPAAGPPPAAGK